MAEVKWIKITTDIFDDEKILLIESLPEADSIIVIWFKLLCLAGKTNNSGVFMLNDKVAYTDKMLSTIFRRKESTVRLAIETFEKFGMIEVIDDVITIPNWGKHQNLDSIESKREYMRDYMQKYREKQKKIVCKTNSKTNSKANVSRIDKDIDKEKDIDKDKIYSVRFEEFWSAYKKKRDKKRAYDCYNARLKDGFSEEELLTACRNYMSECEKENREERYIKDAKTFLSINTPFVDYLPKEPINKEPEHKIFDLDEQYIAPYFGFPEAWFDGDRLIPDRVTPILRPKDTSMGYYEDKTIMPDELIRDYEARRAWHEENSNRS